MTDFSLISIIIPTYNRASLIGETLDSVKAQTYKNWECIIVDDGSSDHTDKLVDDYVTKDARFKYYKRTNNYKSGGNGARNYGLDLAQGDYLVFFDSDDLMTENHLQVKLNLIQSGDFDFAVTRTKYFNYTNDVIDKYYDFTNIEINKENYILQNINWLTLDVIIKAEYLKNVRFNEILQSGQEYNYFSKFLCITEKGVFKDEVVSLRRHHDNSKRTTVALDDKLNKSKAISFWFTYCETKNFLSVVTARKLLYKSYKSIIAFESIPDEIHFWSFWIAIFKAYRANFVAKFFYYIINKFSKRFFFLKQLALKK